MKRRLIGLLLLAGFATAAHATQYYDRVIVSTTDRKATHYYSGDLKQFNNIDDSTTSFEINGGSITKINAISVNLNMAGAEIIGLGLLPHYSTSAASKYYVDSVATAVSTTAVAGIYGTTGTWTANQLFAGTTLQYSGNIVRSGSIASGVGVLALAPGSTVQGDFAGVMGGSTNSATANYAGTLYGHNNSIVEDGAVILGAEMSSIIPGTGESHYSAIVGGSSNTITSGTWGFMGGGHNGSLSGDASGMVGGWNNTVASDGGFIGGSSGTYAAGYGAAFGCVGCKSGAYGFVSGMRARTDWNGCTVISDSQDEDFNTTTGSNMFHVRFAEGMHLFGKEIRASTAVVSTDGLSLGGAFQTLPTTGYSRGTLGYQLSDNNLYFSTETVASANSWLPVTRASRPETTSWDGPWAIEGTTVTWSLTPQNVPGAGTALFAAEVSSTTNWAVYNWFVPDNFKASSAVSIRMLTDFPLGFDTSSRTYVVSVATMSPNVQMSAGSSLPIVATIVPVGTGVPEAPQSVTNVELTGWASLVVPGQWAYIFVARAGDSVVLDPSTVGSKGCRLSIKYWVQD